jgi:alkylated DNA repair dioxygenase AlkB
VRIDGKKERKRKGSSYWETSLSRRVQHFGFRFNYQTRLLDAPRDMCPVPPFIADMVTQKLQVERGEEEEGEEEKVGIMTQMTINEYYPGQGISSHIGT